MPLQDVRLNSLWKCFLRFMMTLALLLSKGTPIPPMLTVTCELPENDTENGAQVKAELRPKVTRYTISKMRLRKR